MNRGSKGRPSRSHAASTTPSSSSSSSHQQRVTGGTSEKRSPPCKQNVPTMSSRRSSARLQEKRSSTLEWVDPQEVQNYKRLCPNLYAKESKRAKDSETSIKAKNIPTFAWGESEVVWQLMLKKDEAYHREQHMLSNHTTIHPHMRAEVIIWLMEVCEVYEFYRQTLYMATDYLDRYLAVTKGIDKQKVQLLATSCLSIAAKMQEIHPPKLTEFADLTDGACTANEILDQELDILKALRWDLSPVTPPSWLNVYIQILNKAKTIDDEYVIPKHTAQDFVQIARLLDLCSLDVASLQWPYSVVTAAAVHHISSADIALSVSGYKWVDIAPCVQWMAPFAKILAEHGEGKVRGDANIQRQEVNINLLEKALGAQTGQGNRQD